VDGLGSMPMGSSSTMQEPITFVGMVSVWADVMQFSGGEVDHVLVT